MSFYATIQGSIRYDKQQDFDAAMELLVRGQWMKDGRLVREDDRPISDGPDADPEARTLRIPRAHYRNLAWALGEGDLFQGGQGKVVWTSTDGTFSAGVINNGKEDAYDLIQWGTPKLGEPPDVDTSPEAYAYWQNEVEQAFFAAFRQEE
jgi:hypothetical protein